MSTYRVIQDIGTALISVLWNDFQFDNKIKPEIIESDTQITLDSPADMTDQHKLSLFLFRIAENPFMRNQEIEQMNSAQLVSPACIVDLHYLITPRTKDKTKDHLLVGKILQIFHDHPVLRDQDFQEIESLKNSTEELRVTFNPLPMETITELWNLFRDKPYMLSLCYQVSPVSIDSITTMEAKRVKQKDMEYYQIVGKKENA
jgi:hypothetical protein